MNSFLSMISFLIILISNNSAHINTADKIRIMFICLKIFGNRLIFTQKNKNQNVNMVENIPKMFLNFAFIDLIIITQ